MSIDPEILLGLQNSRQNQNSLELQQEIIAMQKLQVLNQVRISQGLPPLAQLPQPPPPPPQPKEPLPTLKDAGIAVIWTIGIIILIIFVLTLFK
jgi:hypothetical protein